MNDMEAGLHSQVALIGTQCGVRSVEPRYSHRETGQEWKSVVSASTSRADVPG